MTIIAILRNAFLRKAWLALVLVACAASLPGPALAQAGSDCASVAPLMKDRARLMQRIEGFRRKKPSADEACAVFGSLVKNGSQLIPWVETNGAWCHVPGEFISGLKSQQAQLVKVRGNACQAAAQQKKMMEQARKGQQPGGGAPHGFSGGDEIVGGPIRMPQGAL